MNPNDPAFPVEYAGSRGLTKREYFAALAMQGIRASDVNDDWGVKDTARVAVEQADALIAELSKEKS